MLMIGSKRVSAEDEPFIIAELGVNHDGDVGRAIDLVDAAANAGADAIKVQWFEAARLLSKAARPAGYQTAAGESDPFAMLARLELTAEQMLRIVERAHRRRMAAIATVFSVGLVEEAARLEWDAFKIASPDVVNTPLLERVSEAGRPVIISTGAATESEILTTAARFGSAFLHCVSAYPTPEEKAHLAGIRALEEVLFRLDRPTPARPVGYSDHTTGVETGAMAVAAGAAILEKHLTYDREARGPDHRASLEPEGFGEYVRGARRTWEMMGERRVVVQSIENDVRTLSRQSVTTARGLPAGHVLAASDLTIKRPGTGLAPKSLERLIGRRLRRAVEADMPLTEDDVNWRVEDEAS